MIRRFLIIIFVLCATQSFAQRATISTDVAKWGLSSPNIAASIALTSRITADVEFSANPFGEIYGENKFTHVAISPQLLWWAKRPYYSHCFGINAVATVYDVKVGENTAQGEMGGVGLVYGYGFILGERWAFTPTIGLGGGAFRDGSNGEITFRPTVTKFGVNFSYIID